MALIPTAAGGGGLRKYIDGWMLSSLEQIELKHLGDTGPDDRFYAFCSEIVLLKSIILQGSSNEECCHNEDLTWCKGYTLEDPPMDLLASD
jgi:hypothetical protein